MRVLGVDPGSVRTGWGLLGGSPSRPELIRCGEIRLRRAEALAARLHRLASELKTVVRDVEPTAAAVESPFHGANARSALQLAHARGVILAVLAEAGVEVVEYTPATVKKTVTGNGRAEKVQVQSMVSRLIGAGRGDLTEDVADALAVALCHLSHGARAMAVSREERSRR